MIGTAPTPTVRNIPPNDPHGTSRATSTNDMWISSPAIPNKIDVIYNIGIPIISDIGLFSIQNKTLNADLLFKISLPIFLVIAGSNNREIFLPRNSNTVIQIKANEKYLKNRNPAAEPGVVSLTITPLNFEGPIFVQNSISLPTGHSGQEHAKSVEHNIPHIGHVVHNTNHNTTHNAENVLFDEILDPGVFGEELNELQRLSTELGQ